MTEQHYQDLIPFYIANTLSVGEKRALEIHLRDCATCRSMVDEWRMVADTVWRETDVKVGQLPPLSARVRQQAQARRNPNGNVPQPISTEQAIPVHARPAPRQAKPNPVSRFRVPLTAVAGFIGFFLFAGILIMMNAPPDDSQLTDVLELSSVPTLQGTQVVDNFAGPGQTIPGIMDTPENQTMVPVASRTPTFTPSPTYTPSPFASPNGTTPAFGGGGSLTGACLATNATGFDIEIREFPAANSDLMGVMRSGEAREIRIWDGGSWLQLRYGAWVMSSDVILSGDCSTLMTATPLIPSNSTTIPGVPSCVATNISGQTIPTYRFPDVDSGESFWIMPDEQRPVLVQFGTDWIELYYGDWVQREFVSLSGENCNLWNATPTFPPPATTTPAPPPEGPYVVVDAPGAILRMGPSLDFWAAGSLDWDENLALPVKSMLTINTINWYEVTTPDGRSGWVEGVFVRVENNGGSIPVATSIPSTWTPSPAPFPEGPYAIVDQPNAVLRYGPSQTYTIVANLSVDERVPHRVISMITDSGLLWWEIITVDGQRGWVRDVFVRIDNPMNIEIPFATSFPPTWTPSPTRGATSTFTPTPTPFSQQPTHEPWAHTTTVLEHGCGGQVGRN